MAAFLDHLRETFPQGTPDELAAYVRGIVLRDDVASIKNLCCVILTHSALPAHIRRDILPTVSDLGEGGYFKAMKVLAQWYGDRASKDFEFRQAVRWIEAARRVDPEDEWVVELLQDLQGTGFFARIRYGVARRTVMRDGLPGA